MNTKSSKQEEAFAKIQPVIDQFLPIIRSFAVGRYAVAISGSYGKGTHDSSSDIDFRLYADDIPATFAEMGAAIQEPKEEWGRKGIKVDDFWPRKISDIDLTLEKLCGGQINTKYPVWTVWGYQLLSDIYNQQALEDPDSIVVNWKMRLCEYPPKLKQAVLRKHLGSLQYWRKDYHYASKVQRDDIVFAAGLSTKLIHAIVQVLFALNETYYVGDGQNLEFVSDFRYQPPEVVRRIRESLYPCPSENTLAKQRQMLLELIDDVERLAASLGYAIERWVGLS
jgi:predicted nucleotidyltransferase